MSRKKATAPRAAGVDLGMPLRLYRVTAYWPDESAQVWHYLNETDAEACEQACMDRNADMVTTDIGKVTFCSHVIDTPTTETSAA